MHPLTKIVNRCFHQEKVDTETAFLPMSARLLNFG